MSIYDRIFTYNIKDGDWNVFWKLDESFGYVRIIRGTLYNFGQNDMFFDSKSNSWKSMTSKRNETKYHPVHYEDYITDVIVLK